jgi:hypothetical protein
VALVDYSSLEETAINTQHGMLVAFGEFLSQHGVLDGLMKVRVDQRRRKYAPQTKLVEFLATIMSGSERLEDMNAGSHPLVKDRVVAQAWGQTGFAHYSTVSRTLDACTDATVRETEQIVQAFGRPFIATTIDGLLRRGEAIVYDLDLTGQAVSSTSTSYPEAAFGWMSDGVRLGYQLARVCLSPAGGERVWLAGFHHPGDMVSSKCLKELVSAAEAQTGVRPRRRIELIGQRIKADQEVLTRTQRLIDQQHARVEMLQETQVRLIGQIYHATEAQKRVVSPQKLSFLQKQHEAWSQRLPRLDKQIAQASQVLGKHQTHLAQQVSVLAQLLAWRIALEDDNRTNPNPPAYVEARMDAGFMSGENLTWLLEMGYCPNTKAPNDRTTVALRARLGDTSQWVRVGLNAEMVVWDNYILHGCPFPVTVALERFKVADTYKYATLIHYRDDPSFPTLPVWFQRYNARQTIEAGNKELKGTFFVQHLMTRSLAGIRLQVLFTGLAANVVRWCVPWLKSCAPTPTPKLIHILSHPRALIHVTANAAALVQQSIGGTAMQFSQDGPLPGVTLFLRGIPAFQPALGLDRPCKINPRSTICLPVAQTLR